MGLPVLFWAPFSLKGGKSEVSCGLRRPVAHKPVTDEAPEVARTSNLIPRNGRWYFNKAYPKELWPVVGRSPIRLALNTDTLEQAQRMRGHAEQRYWAAVDAARKKLGEVAQRPLSEVEAVAIVSRWFLLRNGELDRSHLHQPTSPVDAADKRDPFTPAQLAAFYRAPPWTPRDASPRGKPLHSWGPLLALFHGMRRGEIAQLRIADLPEIDGAQVMLVRPGQDGQRFKTKARCSVPASGGSGRR